MQLELVAEASRFLLACGGQRPSSPWDCINSKPNMSMLDGIVILHEESSFMVLNKPTGLLCQSTYGVDSLIERLRKSLQQRDNSPTPPHLELPHRLDRGSSGILLVAKTRKALACLGEQFHRRKIEKHYRVAVEGIPESEHGEWVDWMRKIPDVAKAELVDAGATGAREAILTYERLAVVGQRSVHRVRMQTGRMHQIRLQFASRGFPVLGDTAYGSSIEWAPQTHSHDEHFALHAEEILFRHPKDGRAAHFQAPLPLPWKTLTACP